MVISKIKNHGQYLWNLPERAPAVTMTVTMGSYLDSYLLVSKDPATMDLAIMHPGTDPKRTKK